MNNTLKNLKINKLINLFKYIILFVFGLIVLYLLISSVTSTALITFFFPPIENTFYEHDSILLHLFFFIIFTTALMFFRKVKINPKIININKVYILIFIFLIFFLMTANFQPKSDQSLVLKIADNMYGFNFSDFKKSGYMDIYPHQRGFVLLIFLFENIFGNYNFHAFQILNIFAFIIYCYCMLNIAKLIFPKDNLWKIIKIKK